MCGIAGFFEPNGFKGSDYHKAALSMRNKLIHRGPDDLGLWLDVENGIAITHTRLSIVDLSPNGSQPMASKDDRYRLVFNGEIYNDLKLRKEIYLVNMVQKLALY